MASLLGLPPVSPELKPILPFLQRAEEVKKQDPIISYWCAYYAAQLGIGLKARDTKSRDVLFALLNVLETMKQSIGHTDAIDIEAVSAAYVENFGLRIFVSADNEDRAGRATKSTAKKFLAAANFLEVLKTFPKTEISETNEDKIRYAKWKASDIAKAFREGRKPTPGPPGWAEEQEELARLRAEKEEQDRIAASLAGEPQDMLPPNEFLSHPSSSAPIIIPRDVEPHFSSSPPRPHQAWAQMGDAPSDTWSTAATPGLSDPPVGAFTTGSSGSPPRSSMDWDGPADPTAGRGKPRSGSDSSTGTARGILKPPSPPHSIGHTRSGSGGSPGSTGRSKSSSPDGEKRVHFSPSTADLSPSKGSSPPKEYQGPVDIYASLPPAASASLGAGPNTNLPYSFPAPHPVAPPQLPPPPPPPSVPSAEARNPPHSAPSSSPPRHYQIYAPAPVAPPPQVVELTPGLIAKAQRHCRFAISSLDYEDAETAKKELRAALQLLGG